MSIKNRLDKIEHKLLKKKLLSKQDIDIATYRIYGYLNDNAELPKDIETEIEKRQVAEIKYGIFLE